MVRDFDHACLEPRITPQTRNRIRFDIGGEEKRMGPAIQSSDDRSVIEQTAMFCLGDGDPLIGMRGVEDTQAACTGFDEDLTFLRGLFVDMMQAQTSLQPLIERFFTRRAVAPKVSDGELLNGPGKTAHMIELGMSTDHVIEMCNPSIPEIGCDDRSAQIECVVPRSSID